MCTNFHTFHIIPFPYHNSIIILEKPDLLLRTDTNLKKLEDQYLSQKYVEPILDLCILPLMRAVKPDGPTTKANIIPQLIFQEVTNKFLLVLQTQKAVKFRTECEKKTLKILKENSLVKISKGCTTYLEYFTFTNTAEITMENPLILANISHNPISPEHDDQITLQLYTIDFQTIKYLQNQVTI